MRVCIGLRRSDEGRVLWAVQMAGRGHWLSTAPSRRRYLMTWAKACGLTPCSQRALIMAIFSLSKPYGSEWILLCNGYCNKDGEVSI